LNSLARKYKKTKLFGFLIFPISLDKDNTICYDYSIVQNSNLTNKSTDIGDIKNERNKNNIQRRKNITGS